MGNIFSSHHNFIASNDNNCISIILSSFDKNELSLACNEIKNIASTTSATLVGPRPHPNRRKVFCLLRSPHVNKNSLEHFELIHHSRFIEIKHWQLETLEQLIALEVPSGVSVN